MKFTMSAAVHRRSYTFHFLLIRFWLKIAEENPFQVVFL